MTKLAVVQSNPTTKNTFITKLVSEVTVSHPIFGDKTKKTTYYISGSKQLVAGTEIELDLAKEFDIIERPFEIDGEEVMLKWLSLK